MTLGMDVVNILFVIGLFYGIYSIFPKGVRERTGKVFLEKTRPAVEEEPGAEDIPEEAEETLEAPEEPREEEGTFLDYIRSHLSEGLVVVERIAPSEPDLLVESKNFKEKFYIETWYLPSLIRKEARLGLEMEYLDGYRKFKEESGRDIFFIVGVGGRKSRPDTLYIIPVDLAEGFIPVERMKKFERPEPDLPIMYYYKKLR